MLGTDAFLVQQEQEPLQLDPNGEQVLGRSPEAAISVTNTMVSRRHCVFSRQEDGSWLLIDCGSRNGVLVNGQRVRDQQTMEHQDIVNVAGEQWVFLLLPAGQRPDQAAQGGNGDGVLDTMELEDGLLGGTGTHLANELERASQIQRKMLVPPPEVPGWNIGVDSEGLGSLNGDFYDIAALPDGRIQILLGDVCGHGIHAALFGTTVLKSNRLLREDIADPRELLVRLNNEACRDTISGHFATVFLAYLHPPSGQIEVLIAGHHDAFLYRAAEGRVERLGQRGVALGITQAEAFEKGIRPVTAHLAQGDMLLQVTDGFLESENEAGEAFDDAGLETFLLEHHADPDLQISTQALNQAIHAHCPDIQDDLTVIALRADAAPDPDLSPHVVPSVAQLEQQATRRIAYYLCQSAHQQTRLMPPRQYLIGRSHEADIQIVDPHVSRRHCLVVWDDERTWLLRDIGSCNPLVVNGRACSQEEVPLCDGDRLQVGSEEYIYRVVPAGVDLQKLLQEADDEALLATIEREPDAPDERDLQGAIDGRGIIDLLQYCRMINRNGCLHVAADEDGRIWLLDGVPVHAVCGAATGLEAILTLITGGSRSFVLHEQERCQERSIAGSFEDLLAALVRAIDDRNRSCPKAAVDLLDTENQPASEDLVIYETPPEEDDAQATAVHASTVFESGGARGSATEIMAAAFPQGALAGRQLGQVKLGICIGRGANAEVYRGRHALLDIDVAVKVLKTGFDEIGQKAKDRLLAEAKLAARVRHQAVVQMIDAGQGPAGELYLVEEFVNGQNLGRRLGGGHRLPIREVLPIASGIAAGLTAIHAQGIIHRDIKPDNILIDESGGVHISDLGLARDITDATAHRLTRTGAVLGTPAYVSPEAIRDSKHIDAAADIYSFGAMLYHLIAGRPPFTGHTAYQVMQRHLKGRPPPVEQLQPQTPPALARLVMRCLHLNPARRPSAAELATALERLVAGQGSTPGKRRGAGKSRSRHARRRPARAALLVLLPLLVALLLWFLVGHA